MEVRKLLPSDDLKAISRIYAESWRAAYPGIVPQAYLDALDDARWVPYLESAAQESLVLLDAGRFVGTASVCPAREWAMSGWGELVSLYLLPDYFGTGGASLLLDAAVSLLRERGYREIYLWVLEKNDRARRFYEKSGFTCRDDTIDVQVGGKPLLEIRYTKH